MSESLKLLIESPDLLGPPLLTGAVAGLVLGWIGVYVVLRRMVFVSAAIAQSAAAGVGLALLLHRLYGWPVPPLLGAGLATALASLLFTSDPTRLRITRESLLGLAYVGSGASALLIGDRLGEEAQEISGLLFGNAVLVRDLDMALIVGAGALSLGLHLWLRRGLIFLAADPEGAKAQGLPTRLLEFTLFATLGLMVALSTRALGALPVFAFCVLPAMAALPLAPSAGAALALAALFGALAGGGGYLAAFSWDLTVGAAQTLTAVAVVVAALVGRAGWRWVGRRGSRAGA